MSDALREIKDEVRDPTAPAVTAEKTFAFKWMNKAFKLSWAFFIACAVTLIAHVIVKVAFNVDSGLPLSEIVIAAVTTASISIGGDKALEAVSKIQANRVPQRSTQGPVNQ